MRKTLMVVAICTAASVVLAATGQFQPINVKTGLWHMTKAIKWTDLPPQMAAMMKAAPQTTSYDSCVTTKDLNSNPFANGSGDGCTWTVLSSTSTDMELRAKSRNSIAFAGITGYQDGLDYLCRSLRSLRCEMGKEDF